MRVIHTACKHCGQDIEGVVDTSKAIYEFEGESEWRDRGNNTHCPTPAGDAGQKHQPPDRIDVTESVDHGRRGPWQLSVSLLTEYERTKAMLDRAGEHCTEYVDQLGADAPEQVLRIPAPAIHGTIDVLLIFDMDGAMLRIEAEL